MPQRKIWECWDRLERHPLFWHHDRLGLFPPHCRHGHSRVHHKGTQQFSRQENHHTIKPAPPSTSLSVWCANPTHKRQQQFSPLWRRRHKTPPSSHQKPPILCTDLQDHHNICTISSLASAQSKITVETAAQIMQIINYATTHPDAVVRLTFSNMALYRVSNTS